MKNTVNNTIVKKLRAILSLYYRKDMVVSCVLGRATPSLKKALLIQSQHGIPLEAWEDIRAWLRKQEAAQSAKEASQTAKAASASKKAKRGKSGNGVAPGVSKAAASASKKAKIASTAAIKPAKSANQSLASGKVAKGA